MSNKKIIKIVCENCQELFEMMVYDIINPVLDMGMRQKVLNTSIFDFICPKCQNRFKSAYSFEYQDIERKYILVFATRAEDLERSRKRKKEFPQ